MPKRYFRRNHGLILTRCRKRHAFHLLFARRLDLRASQQNDCLVTFPIVYISAPFFAVYCCRRQIFYFVSWRILFLCAHIKVEQLFYILFVCQLNWLHLRLWTREAILLALILDRWHREWRSINNRVARFYYTTKQLLVVNRDHGADYLRVQKRKTIACNRRQWSTNSA